MRRDDDGYTVFDIWTGWPAIVKGAEQVGLDIEDADDLVEPSSVANPTSLGLGSFKVDDRVGKCGRRWTGIWQASAITA